MIRVKVCGLLDPRNAEEVAGTGPDFMGFIFYPGSKRFVGHEPDRRLFLQPPGISKTGVFVNEREDVVLKKASRFSLDVVQLHGSETAAYCSAIRSVGLKVIKAVGVDEQFSFSALNDLADACDYFLFDTKTTGYGGSGRRFNWEKIKEYNGDLPFFLSGGIGPDDVNDIRSIRHTRLFAVDINSRFETEKGIKDPAAVKDFINNIKFSGI